MLAAAQFPVAVLASASSPEVEQVHPTKAWGSLSLRPIHQEASSCPSITPLRSEKSSSPSKSSTPAINSMRHGFTPLCLESPRSVSGSLAGFGYPGHCSGESLAPFGRVDSATLIGHARTPRVSAS